MTAFMPQSFSNKSDTPSVTSIQIFDDDWEYIEDYSRDMYDERGYFAHSAVIQRKYISGKWHYRAKAEGWSMDWKPVQEGSYRVDGNSYRFRFRPWSDEGYYYFNI